jgi:hypothetical protein
MESAMSCKRVRFPHNVKRASSLNALKSSAKDGRFTTEAKKHTFLTEYHILSTNY